MNAIKKIILFLGILMTINSQAGEMKLNPYGQHFSGGGLDVEMAFVKDKNDKGLYDALIKITGSEAHNAEIDGLVILHKAVPGGTGIDFKTPDGKNRMGTRKAWGTWDFFEVYFGGKAVKVYLDEKKSKEIKVSDLLKNLKK